MSLRNLCILSASAVFLPQRTQRLRREGHRPESSTEKAQTGPTWILKMLRRARILRPASQTSN